MCMGLRLAYKLGTSGTGKEEGKGSKKNSAFKRKGKRSKLPKYLSAYELPPPSPTLPPQKMHNLFD